MKEKIYKLFLALMVSLSLGSSPIAQNVILKMLEALSGVENVQVYELDEEENESKATRKKKELQNHFSDSL
jgi:hypothetical protein